MCHLHRSRHNIKCQLVNTECHMFSEVVLSLLKLLGLVYICQYIRHVLNIIGKNTACHVFLWSFQRAFEGPSFGTRGTQ